MKTRRMNVWMAGLSVALIAAAGAWTQNREGKARDHKAEAAIGQKAPDFTLKDIDGKTHKLSEHAGKIVVLDWVNPDCPVCRGVHKDGRIAKMLGEFKSAGDVVFLAINSTHYMPAEKNREALEGYKVKYPVLLDADGTVGNLYGAKTTPHLFVIDTTGVLRYQGAIDDDRTGKNTQEGKPVINYAVNAVKQIKAGETVSPNSVPSYGCGVKYPPKEGKGQGKERPNKKKDAGA